MHLESETYIVSCFNNIPFLTLRYSEFEKYASQKLIFEVSGKISQFFTFNKQTFVLF